MIRTHRQQTYLCKMIFLESYMWYELMLFSGSHIEIQGCRIQLMSEAMAAAVSP